MAMRKSRFTESQIVDIVKLLVEREPSPRISGDGTTLSPGHRGSSLGSGFRFLRVLNNLVSFLLEDSMARKPRLFAPGVLYHVIVRGNNRQKTFFNDGD